MPSDHVYIIRQGNTRLFKIGVSNNPQRRLKNLQTGNPHPLKVVLSVPCVGISAYEAEALIHRHLGKERVLGEWFEIASDDRVVAIAQSMLNSLPTANTKEELKLPDVPTHTPSGVTREQERKPGSHVI